ncbi:hypothetical protein [Microbacterium album]|uniref:Lipoprotein n=1 Tax=Microbacterium album TaxID=2053191 RepID=A0A917IDQ4_9MICO|nr:hypothetical protein [Microbacterium album]GGH38796.1 hypothetical protein GCM10010921_09600 [Microbacterium album]
MRRPVSLILLATGLLGGLLLAGCASVSAEPADEAPTAEPSPTASTPAADESKEDPCAVDPAEIEPSGLPHREEVSLPEWWDEPFPLPECGALVLAEQSGKDIDLEYEYATTEAALADAEALLPELEAAGFTTLEARDEEDARYWFFQYEETPGEWAGIDIDIRVLKETNHLIGSDRWPYPYLEISYYDYR